MVGSPSPLWASPDMRLSLAWDMEASISPLFLSHQKEQVLESVWGKRSPCSWLQLFIGTITIENGAELPQEAKDGAPTGLLSKEHKTKNQNNAKSYICPNVYCSAAVIKTGSGLF